MGGFHVARLIGGKLMRENLLVGPWLDRRTRPNLTESRR